MRLVKYNGGTGYYYNGFESPKLLKKNKIYKLLYEEIFDCYTCYYLEGFEGCFNSVWFDDVKNSN